MAIRKTKFWVRAVEAFAFVLFLALALLAWRLSRGPVSLDPIAPYIENALGGDTGGFHIKIGHASLDWSELLEPPTLVVQDVRAVDRRGTVASFPRMTVKLNTGALLRGTIAPEQVALSKPTLRVARHADGSFTFGFEPTSNEAEKVIEEPAGTGGTSLATLLISALTQPYSRDNQASYLNAIAINDARLVLFDEPIGRQWFVPKASLYLVRAGSEVQLSVDFPVVDDERPWSIKSTGRYVRRSGILEMTFVIDGFRPSKVAGLVEQAAPLAALDLRLSGRAKTSFTLGGGAARLNQLDFSIKGEPGHLRLPAPLMRDYPIRRMILKGTVKDAFKRVTLERLEIDLDAGEDRIIPLVVSGNGLRLNESPEIDLNIGIDNLQVSELQTYWPESVKEGARKWIVSNLRNGALTQSNFQVKLAGPSLGELDLANLSGTSTLTGIDVTYMKGLPEVEGTGGILELGTKEITISLNEGHVPDSITGRGVQVRSGAVKLHRLGEKPEFARVTLDLTGDLGEVLRLIDHQPLGYASAMDIDATLASGETAVQAKFDFPLVKSLALDDIRIGVKASVDGANIPDVALGQPLTDSQLTFALDRKGMDVKGSIALAGVPGEIIWRENFGGGAFRSRYEIDAVLDNAGRPLAGLTAMIFAPPYIDGPVPTYLVYTVKRDGTAKIEAMADLTPATVEVNQLGWRKMPGIAAQAEVTAEFVDGHLRSVPTFQITSEDSVDIAGDVAFSEGGVLTSVVLTRATAADSFMTGELALDDRGVYQLDVRGPAFNSRYFWRELGRDDARVRGDENQRQTPLEVRAAFDRMWLGDEGDFRDVKLIFRRGTRGIERIDFSSKIDGEAPFTFLLESRDGKRTFRGESANGGGVVRAVGLSDDVVGGDLTIDGEMLSDGSIEGDAEIKDLKVVDAPVLARLLSVASLSGIVDQLSGGGISFEMLKVPFSYAHSALEVKNGEMYGSSLGLTGKGTYSFAESRMDFDGTIVPAYTINNIFNSIPLIGDILTGTEKGGGMVAMTYTYRGDVATAQPSVNPLAAFTPGITRQIFDIFSGPQKTSPVPSDRQPADNPPPGS